MSYSSVAQMYKVNNRNVLIILLLFHQTDPLIFPATFNASSILLPFIKTDSKSRQLKILATHFDGLGCTCGSYTWNPASQNDYRECLDVCHGYL